MRRLHHPLWTHLPAMAGVAAGAWLLATAGLPARVPVHFNATGAADRFGSPIELYVAFVLVPLLFVIGGAILDEAYARHEDRKHFNFLALFDEAMVGISCGILLRTLPEVHAAAPRLTGVLPTIVLMVLALVAAGAVAEALRPHRPRERVGLPEGAADTGAAGLQEALAEALTARGDFVYWEAQNPLWFRILIVLTELILLGAGALAALQQPWLLAVFVPPALLLLAFYGGLQVTVSRQRLMVRIGAWGIPVLRVALPEITSAEAVDFNPLGDFGGWGIRYSLRKKMWGFFMSGSRGVEVHTARGKRYLLGSDRPDRLAGLLQAARGMAAP